MGFYVSSFAVWPVQTEGRFKLQVGDLEVAGVAAVAASYPGVGMGLAFVELSPDEEAKLERLLKDLKKTASGSPGVVTPI